MQQNKAIYSNENEVNMKDDVYLQSWTYFGFLPHVL